MPDRDVIGEAAALHGDARDWSTPQSVYTVSFPQLVRRLKTTPWRWTRREADEVLNGLNLLWDLAESLDRADLRSGMLRGQVLGRCMDALTSEMGGDLADLSELPQRQVAKAVEELVFSLLEEK